MQKELLGVPSSPLDMHNRSEAGLNGSKSISFEELNILEPPIGTGAFGVVYQGVFRGTTVAVKKLVNWKTDALKEFMHEVSLMRALSHPNLVLFMGACTCPPDLFIVTEFLFGGDLNQLIIQKSVEIDWQVRLRMVHEIAKGMAYLHSSSVLHRDFKSNNILLDEAGHIKVADFGLSKVLAAQRGVLNQSQAGNWAYMAPEMMKNLPYDESIDVYGFGVILCELIARLDAGDDDMPRNERTFAVDVKSFSSLAPVDTPEVLLSLAHDCCAVFPARRPSFMAVLARLRNSMEVFTTTPPPTTSTSSPSLSRKSSGSTLAISVTSNSPHAYLIPHTNGKHIAHVSTAEEAAFAITDDGLVFAWGSLFAQPNEGLPALLNICNGKRVRAIFARNDTSRLHVVTDLGGLFTLTAGKLAVKAPTTRTMALSAKATFAVADDRLWGWGEHRFLGGESSGDELVLEPTVNTTLKGVYFMEVAAGHSHDSEAYGWGHNEDSQLGQVDKPFIVSPERIQLRGEVVAAVACGDFHSAFLTHTGAVYTCGRNIEGQLGLGDMTPHKGLCLVESLKKYRAVQIACGGNCTAAIVDHGHIYEDRNVYVWGQMGTESICINSSASPQAVAELSRRNTHQIVCSRSALVALTESTTDIVASDKSLAALSKRASRGDINSLITDREARQFWDEEVGPLTMLAPWSAFVAKLATRLSKSEEALQPLRELLVDDSEGQVTQIAFGRLLKWFPSFPAGIDQALSVLALKFFFGLMDKSETEKTLSATPPGTFLLRLSTSSPGDFVLATVTAERRVVQITLKPGSGDVHAFLTKKIDDLTAARKILSPLQRSAPVETSGYEPAGTELLGDD